MDGGGTTLTLPAMQGVVWFTQIARISRIKEENHKNPFGVAQAYQPCVDAGIVTIVSKLPSLPPIIPTLPLQEV